MQICSTNGANVTVRNPHAGTCSKGWKPGLIQQLTHHLQIHLKVSSTFFFSFDRRNRNRAFLPYVFETTSLRRVPGMKHLDTSGISYSNYHTTRYSVHEYMISGMILHYVLVFHILPYGKPTHFKWVAHHFAGPRLWRASKQGQRWCERSLNLFWSPPKMTFP